MSPDRGVEDDGIATSLLSFPREIAPPPPEIRELRGKALKFLQEVTMVMVEGKPP
jgi:hypothetical protein